MSSASIIRSCGRYAKYCKNSNKAVFPSRR
jgi:hypothetical protein